MSQCRYVHLKHKDATNQLSHMSADESLRNRAENISTAYFGAEVNSEADYIGYFAPGSRHLRVGDAISQY